MDVKEITVVQPESYELTRAEYTKTASDYLAAMGNKLSEAQRTQFINLCTGLKLNPFLREIHAIPFGNDFNIVVGFEVYLKRAARTGLLNGWHTWTEGEGQQMKAVIEIKRKDWAEPFVHEVYLSEYSSGKSMWAKAPKTMLKKVVMSQGFRLCFPDDLAGMPYTTEELTTDTSLESANAAEPEAPEMQSNIFNNTSFEEVNK